MKLFLYLFLLSAFFMTGCTEEKKVRIGVSQCSTDDWRMTLNEEIMREEIFHPEVEVEIRSADDNNAKQIADLEYFAKNDFDIIIVSPNEAKAVTPKIKALHDSGMPIVVFDREASEKCYSAFVGADNHDIGLKAAQYALLLPDEELNILEITGLPGSTPAMKRGSGFDEVMTENGGRARIVAKAAGNWNYEDAFAVADSILAVHQEINVIYAHNDRMAIGASDAAKKHGIKDMKIIGVDGVPSTGLKAVADGVITATFLYPTEGCLLFRKALAIVNGSPFEEETIITTPTVVTKDNAGLMLMLDQEIQNETRKVKTLKGQVDEYWSRHSAQTTVLYSVVAILVLLSILFYMLLRYYWARKHHYAAIMAQKQQLEQQQATLTSLYEQLRDATQSKLTFFTNVSHDLRTPLTLIAEPVAQMVRADNITPQQSAMMRLADKNVKVLMRLINQILDFRKAENGKMTYNPVETDMRTAILDWSDAFRRAAVRKHLAFTVNIMEAESYSMAVDIEKLERIYFNLISNAFKYTPQNGSVAVDMRQENGKLIIKVSDNGQGISEENRKQIFERFFRADQVTPNGSGIGLALTKSFVELHGGAIDVESTEGKGSVFTVELPVTHVDKHLSSHESLNSPDDVTEELADIEAPEPEQEEADGRPTALVIDDNADIRTLVYGLLCDKYNIIQASNGAQGIRMASRYIPDIIICDVMMPGTDGLETCRHLKNEVTTSHIPVLLLTACALDEQRVAGYECGADAYLSKPFNSRVLTARCESLILNRRRISLQVTEDKEKPAPELTKPDSNLLPQSDIDDEFYRRFVEVVEAELGNNDLTVEDLGAKTGLSRVQLYRKIKALTNYSPTELLKIIRLRKAEKMLKSTRLTISEVCYAVGFSSPSYFTKCYREQFDESPSDTQQRTSRMK